MQIWTVERLQTLVPGTLMAQLGLQFTGMGHDWLAASMPVDPRTRQTYGLLHGGASAAMVETLGSVAAQLSVDRDAYRCFGLAISANHVRAVKEGLVHGVARAQHIGRSTHIWDVRLHDDAQRLVCLGQLTVMVRPSAGAPGAPLVPHHPPGAAGSTSGA